MEVGIYHGWHNYKLLRRIKLDLKKGGILRMMAEFETLIKNQDHLLAYIDGHWNICGGNK